MQSSGPEHAGHSAQSPFITAYPKFLKAAAWRAGLGRRGGRARAHAVPRGAMPKGKKKAPIGLSIRTSEDSSKPLNRSYNLWVPPHGAATSPMAGAPSHGVLGVRRRTKSGVYTNKGFKIDSKGIQESPAAFGGARRRQFMVNDMEDLEIGAVIGHGAGGVVVRPARPPARPPRAPSAAAWQLTPRTARARRTRRSTSPRAQWSRLRYAALTRAVGRGQC